MTQKKRVLVLAAAMAALGVGLSGSAAAYTSMAASAQNITNGFFTVVPNGVTGGAQVGGTTSSNTSANINSTAITGSAADSDVQPRGHLPPADALCSTVGIACAENTFSIALPAGNYAQGDAQIISEQIGAGTSIAARNSSRYRLDSAGTAGAVGGNSSVTGFTLSFAVLPGTADLFFSFDNDPYLTAFLDTVGGSAGAFISAVLTITNDALNTTINWAMNGIAGDLSATDCTATFGAGAACSDLLDPFDLNASLSVTSPGPQLTYAPGNSSYLGRFLGVAPGNYTLSLQMQERTQGNLPALVPEPGTLALLGVSLALLTLRFRRKGEV